MCLEIILDECVINKICGTSQIVACCGDGCTWGDLQFKCIKCSALSCEVNFCLFLRNIGQERGDGLVTPNNH